MLEFVRSLFGRKKQPAPTPEEDIALARAALERSELKHAAFHVGCALAADPTRREWLDLLERISDLAPDPLQLAPLEKENYFATMAVRAYLLERLNRLPEAEELLYQTVLARPDVPYLEWAVTWLEDPENASRFEPSRLQWFLAELVGRLPALQPPLGNGEATVERLPRLVRAALRLRAESEYLPFLCAGIMRRIGFPEEALEIAREAHREKPTYASAVALGTALQELGDHPAAIAAYQEALAFKPEEVSVRLSLGDVAWEMGDRDQAARWYSEALEREPEQEWARPSLYVVEFERTGDPAWRDRLAEYAAAHPDNDRARFLMGRFHPYFGTYLPDPSEAIVNVARDLLGKREAGAEEMEIRTITVSYLEAPSAVLSIQQELRRRGLTPPEEVVVARVPSPDPRKPWGRVDYHLWRYEGTAPRPALPPPAPEVAAAVAGIARTPYSYTGWLEAAREAGRELGPAAAEDLLRVMVHPPDPPDELRAWSWRYRTQVAAALVLSRIETGWKGSVRRSTLFSLVRGPMDWTVEAALLALAAIAAEDPEAEQEIAQLHLELFRHMPREGAVCYLEVLCLAALRRPNLTEAERAHWNQVPGVR